MDNREQLGNQSLEEDEQFQIIVQDYSSSPEDVYFDTVVGALQDIIVEEEFENIQTHFMNKYCSIFDNTEENKFQYTEIFTLYQKEIEAFVDKSLHQRVPDFEMSTFLALLQTRHDQIDEIILDMLQSFTEFTTFKKLMLEHRAYITNQDNLQSLSIKSKGIS